MIYYCDTINHLRNFSPLWQAAESYISPLCLGRRYTVARFSPGRVDVQDNPDRKSHWFATSLKISSYIACMACLASGSLPLAALGTLPVLAVIVKGFYRWKYNIQVVRPQNPPAAASTVPAATRAAAPTLPFNTQPSQPTQTATNSSYYGSCRDQTLRFQPNPNSNSYTNPNLGRIQTAPILPIASTLSRSGAASKPSPNTASNSSTVAHHSPASPNSSDDEITDEEYELIRLQEEEEALELIRKAEEEQQNPTSTSSAQSTSAPKNRFPENAPRKNVVVENPAPNEDIFICTMTYDSFGEIGSNSEPVICIAEGETYSKNFYIEYITTQQKSLTKSIALNDFKARPNPAIFTQYREDTKDWTCPITANPYTAPYYCLENKQTYDLAALKDLSGKQKSHDGLKVFTLIPNLLIYKGMGLDIPRTEDGQAVNQIIVKFNS